jgi:AraC-like DNA-binding protein
MLRRTAAAAPALLLLCLFLRPAAALTPRELVHNIKNKTYAGDRIEMVVTAESLADIMARFQEISGLAFKLDPSLEQRPFPPRRYNFMGYPWDRALDSVLTDAGLGLRLEGDVLWVEPFAPEKDKTVSAFLVGSISAAAMVLLVFFLLARRRSKRKAANRERKITLDPETAENALERLNYMFRVEKIYRSERLSLDSLSERLGYQPHQLSGLINGRLGKSFTELLADYRVEEAKKRLSDPGEKAHILNIAFNAGFGTKASFNRIFKARTGLTPSEFRRKHSPDS